jgi:DNA-binding NarL/FixJ family response regulator
VARSVIAVVPHELLTSRECEVAKLIARGYTNRQIAQALVVTEGTAANHVAHILSKLGVANRTQVAARMLDA